MNPKLKGFVTVVFIRGGIAKSGKPYLQVSNGRAEMFVNIPKGSQLVNDETFQNYKEDDLIDLEVSQTIGSENVTLVSIV
jgi:hypothetical protein